MKNPTKFDQCQQIFNQLKIQKLLPRKMQIKLQLLLDNIKGRQVNDPKFQQLPNYERISLLQIPINTKTQLFCNIVNCLSGREIIVYYKNQKSYFRKEQFFRLWSECYITIDTNCIYIKKKLTKKNYQIFQLNQIKISKQYKQDKNKILFEIIDKNKKYLLGFDTQIICKRIHSTLKQIIKQSKNKISIYKKEQIVQKQKQQQHVQKEDIHDNKCLDQNQQIYQEDFHKIISEIQNIPFHDHEKYNLLYNFEYGRIMLHSSNKNILKHILILSSNQPQIIIELYTRFMQWNPQIEISQIKNKLGNNSYIIYLKFKKYSLMSYKRDALVIVSSFKINKKYYIDIKSINNNQIYDSSCIRTDYKQEIQISINEQTHKILMTIISENNFNGYNSDQDNKNMSLTLLKNLQYFPQFVLSHEILSTKNLLFNFNAVNFNRKKSIEIQQQQSQSQQYLSSNRSKNLQKSQKLQNQQISIISNKQQINQTKNQYQNFADILSKSYCQSDIESNLLLLKLIKKKQHENYQIDHKFDQNCYIEPKKMQYTRQEPQDFILQNSSWRITQQGDFVFQNQQYLKIQKGIIKYILKQLGSNLFSGKSVMNMSLPVEIFDNLSMLERVAGVLGYSAKYLYDASKTTDNIQQMKKIIIYIISSQLFYLKTQKPFNPILGQTFTCRIGGIPLYLEQISHHPPICAFYMKTQYFEYYGNYHSDIQMGLNSCYAMNYSTQFLNIFHTGTRYELKSPDLQIIGLIYGDRKYRPHGKCFIHERTNNIFGEYSMSKDKKKIYESKNKLKPIGIYGGIYKVTQNFGNKFKNLSKKYKFDGITNDDIIQKYAYIQGTWSGDVFINNQLARNINDPLPNKIEHQKYILPSDSNLRPDLIYKRIGDLKKSNQQKQIMENIQRRDRKLRQNKKK